MMEDIKVLNNELRNSARVYGLCDKWYNEWDMRSDEGLLIEKFKKGIDFCIEHNYPALSVMKKRFSRSELNKHHVYVDETIPEDGESDVYVFNGNCVGDITFSSMSVATLYVRHTSDIHIHCSGFSKVFISVYDNANVHVDSCDSASVYVYRRSSKCVVETDGNVLIR